MKDNTSSYSRWDKESIIKLLNVFFDTHQRMHDNNPDGKLTKKDVCDKIVEEGTFPERSFYGMRTAIARCFNDRTGLFAGAYKEFLDSKSKSSSAQLDIPFEEQGKTEQEAPESVPDIEPNLDVPYNNYYVDGLIIRSGLAHVQDVCSSDIENRVMREGLIRTAEQCLTSTNVTHMKKTPFFERLKRLYSGFVDGEDPDGVSSYQDHGIAELEALVLEYDDTGLCRRFRVVRILL